jgi:hypothetical protein
MPVSEPIRILIDENAARQMSNELEDKLARPSNK